MFKVTSSAYEFLQDQVDKEKQTEEEILFVRLSMGIG
jgi:hypothetical protein